MPGGRPTKRTPDVEAKILKAISEGATRRDAALAAGIGEETFYGWVREIPEFSEAVARAEAECLNRVAARLIAEATKRGGDWRAAEAVLKRRRPQEWGDKQQTELTGNPLQTVIVLPSNGRDVATPADEAPDE